jgi:hypothetical protein
MVMMQKNEPKEDVDDNSHGMVEHSYWEDSVHENVHPVKVQSPDVD